MLKAPSRRASDHVGSISKNLIVSGASTRASGTRELNGAPWSKVSFASHDASAAGSGAAGRFRTRVLSTLFTGCGAGQVPQQAHTIDVEALEALPFGERAQLQRGV